MAEDLSRQAHRRAAPERARRERERERERERGRERVEVYNPGTNWRGKERRKARVEAEAGTEAKEARLRGLATRAEGNRGQQE